MTPAEMDAIVEAVGHVLRESLTEIRVELRTEFKANQEKPIDVEAIAERAAALIKAPKDGKDGKDAEPVDIDSIVIRAAELVPRPENGKDGKDGAVGPVGPQGERGLPGESIIGPKGDIGEPGIKGEKGDRGENGINGKDGRNVEPEEVERLIDLAVNRSIDQWALDFERRAQDVFQRAIDKMPKPQDGKDGRDALEIEDFDVQHDGDGNLVFHFKRGELEKTFDIRLPRMRHKGIYKEGNTYREGDTAILGGSTWIAVKDGELEKPGTGDGWQLMAQRGRDADRPRQEPPPPGPVRLK